jgi:hypothetical protein
MVTATFTLNAYALTVNKAGAGNGTVTSAPSGIDCGATCTANFGYNTVVTLTAAASTGSTFTGWSSGCSGTGVCVVTMDAAKSVTATFTPQLDSIFGDSFESGGLTAWSASSTDGGHLSVSTGAAMVGTLGLQAFINDNNSMCVTDATPQAEKRYRARFYFDPNSITMASGNAHYIFYGYSGTSTNVLRIEFRYYLRNYQLRAGLRGDGSTWTNTSWFAITDAPHSIEFDWRAAAAAGTNDGGLTLWLDGVQKAALAGIDNDTRQIDQVQLGVVSGVDSRTLLTRLQGQPGFTFVKLDLADRTGMEQLFAERKDDNPECTADCGHPQCAQARIQRAGASGEAMMAAYQVTGAAGFIGYHLSQRLLKEFTVEKLVEKTFGLRRAHALCIFLKGNAYANCKRLPFLQPPGRV